MSHHVHPVRGSDIEGRLVWSVLLTTAFVIGEALAGYVSHSLALLSDAGHNLSDLLALALSWYALRLGKRRADARRTYGYHRVGILAALANAVSLVVIALFIFWEAYQRLQSPAPVEGGVVIGVAIAGLLVNGLISLWLRGDASHDLNVRSAYLHMLGDALSAVGVLVAGLIVSLTKSPVADPVASIGIGILLLWSSWSVLAEATNILLEAAPKDWTCRLWSRRSAPSPESSTCTTCMFGRWDQGSPLVVATSLSRSRLCAVASRSCAP